MLGVMVLSEQGKGVTHCRCNGVVGTKVLVQLIRGHPSIDTTKLIGLSLPLSPYLVLRVHVSVKASAPNYTYCSRY